MKNWDSLTEQQKTALFVEQDENEIRSVELGVARFREQCARTPKSQWSAGRQLVATAVEDVVHGVEMARLGVEKGRTMRGACGWSVPFLVMDPGVLALTALSVMLDGHNADDRGVPLAKLVATLGDQLEMEYHMMMLRTEAPALKAVMDRRVVTWNRRSIARARERMGQLGAAWPLRVKRLTAAKLIGIVLRDTDLFNKVLVQQSRRKRVNLVRLSDRSVTALSETNEQLELNHPVCMPMVVPPGDWGPGQRGGYRILSRYYSAVIRKSAESSEEECHAPEVYDALNKLQRTEWRVNVAVFQTMRQVWAAGGGWAGIPPREDTEMPTPYPESGTDEDKKAWRQSAALIHQKNARLVGRRLSFLRCLSQAEELFGKVFYFPHRFDFRGRVYPLSTHLSPQSHDVSRGLLTFAEGKRLGPQGYFWLLVHFANGWGEDKRSFADRVQWSLEKLAPLQDSIIRMDHPFDPEDYEPLNLRSFWSEAEDPWQTLATLMELVEAWKGGNPNDHVSHLPVSMDGSNSGLQHFSALLRDERAGRMVNLTPAEQPQDIYSVVAERARRAVDMDVRAGYSDDTTIEDLPKQWLEQGISRKTVKRPTMTFVYGVTLQGMRDALVADGHLDWTPQPLAAVKYISRKMWASVTDAVPKAAEAMEWLRDCARVANRAGILLSWTTPDGFIVRVPYYKYSTTRIKCLNCEVQFDQPGVPKGVSDHRQRNSMPPNFIHGLDATHLRMTLRYGWALGIDSWMMIHDSFGCHACSVDDMHRAIRETMVDLYEPDLLTDFRLQVVEQTGDDPGPPPPSGNLDLKGILNATYLFS